jgi:hypothetical protein
VRQILTHPRTSGHTEYRGEIVRRNAYEPILHEDVRQALITLFSDPALVGNHIRAATWFIVPESTRLRFRIAPCFRKRGIM